ncbi:MAG: DUF3990 domain-containing protein [Paludibacteraceae bacterium]|nr:DUF3990 domain-containing protein [Paludibacteraceae bacterium]
MELYHGSTVIVKNPSIRQGRANTDFGKGFYTTIDYEQAARWAQIRRERAGAGNAIVSVYTIDDGLLKRNDLNIMQYSGATIEWLDFVVANRRYAPIHDYDIVLGPVANDNLYATISMYENGELSAEAAIVQLKTHVLFNQVSFHTQTAIANLRFDKEMRV